MNNENVRNALREHRIKQWELAYFLGVSEQTLLRWLRTPLPKEKEERLFAAIRAMSGGSI